jgi:hypothetical protein
MFRFVHRRSLARRKQFEAEMDEEFRFHREARIEHFRPSGLHQGRGGAACETSVVTIPPAVRASP